MQSLPLASSESATPQHRAVSSKDCVHFQACRRFVIEELGAQEYLNERYNRCYCIACCEERGEAQLYERGSPSHRNAPPRGWCRFGLTCSEQHPTTKEAFRSWHVAYPIIARSP